jgi:hypothetical protein
MNLLLEFKGIVRFKRRATLVTRRDGELGIVSPRVLRTTHTHFKNQYNHGPKQHKIYLKFGTPRP